MHDELIAQFWICCNFSNFLDRVFLRENHSNTNLLLGICDTCANGTCTPYGNCVCPDGWTGQRCDSKSLEYDTSRVISLTITLFARS